jgi:hypothetical protein
MMFTRPDCWSEPFRDRLQRSGPRRQYDGNRPQISGRINAAGWMLGGATLVSMMKSTHLRDRHDTTSVWWLDAAPLGRILFQTQVRTAPMIVI